MFANENRSIITHYAVDSIHYRVLIRFASLTISTIPELIDFKVSVLAYRVLHVLAPPYLEDLVRVADLPGRRRLRSSTTRPMSLHVPAHRLSTIGRRSFSVAAPTTWNSLPADVQSSTSLPLFCQRIKTYLFKKSFPDVILF